MAGGIDWFRWHHGSVTDPKFQLVARKSGASLPDVLAVWAYLLEKASASEFRGSFGDVDFEAVDCLFGFDEGTTDCIMGEMVSRKLIADEYIVAWEKRQPKRERENDNSTERVRAFREKQRNETPCNANETAETPREEESREEKKEPIGSSLASKRRKRIPPDFSPNHTGIELALQKGVKVEDELQKFTDYHSAKGSVMADWQAAWRTWVGNASSFAKQSQRPMVNRQEAIEARNKAAGLEWLRQEGISV